MMHTLTETRIARKMKFKFKKGRQAWFWFRRLCRKWRTVHHEV